ncbi:MAG: LPS export ABC transporter periplasmic protein LptC [Gammaproteobacteria bacterium]|nr:LPS export ABC transporter periplasmic protein LptC [Gammaproteobacteria bacterium]
MSQRSLMISVLFVAAVASVWLLRRLSEEQTGVGEQFFHDPDYYMEDFTTLSMDTDGTPKNRLYAVYMAHYPDDDTTELLQPKLEIYRIERPPLFITAEKGWVTRNNDVILLRGSVRLWEDDELGKRTLQVDTTDVRVLLNDEYAETDQPAIIVSKRSTIRGAGIRAWMKENRLEVLRHERTTIEQAPGAAIETAR